MDFLELYVRRSDSGGRYVVAKTGMLVAGVIFPVQAVNEGFCDKRGRTGVADAAGAGQAFVRAAGG